MLLFAVFWSSLCAACRRLVFVAVLRVLLSDVCCLSFVMRGALLFAVVCCCSLFVAVRRCLLCVDCCLMRVGRCCLLVVVCWSLLVVGCW